MVLLLAPTLTDAGPLRLVSDGTGSEPVSWYLDGDLLGTTLDDRPLVVEVSSGPHELAAVADYDGPWQVLARPEPVGSGVAYVDAWTARHEGTVPEPECLPWLAPAGLASLAAAVWLWPSRSKNP